MPSIAYARQAKIALGLAEPFREIDRRRNPETWRGFQVRTPYFAAADFVNNGSATGSNYVVMPQPKTGSHESIGGASPLGMLEALHWYGIAGWSSMPRCK
jgi:hypothetical protein